MGIQGYGDTETGILDTGIRRYRRYIGYRDIYVGYRGYRDTEIQGYGDTGIRGYRDRDMEDTGIRGYGDT